MRDYKLYIFDLDGTLYRGNQALPFAAEVVGLLKSKGSAVRFLTNNSGSRPADLVLKLRQMGIPADLDEILTSGMGAATYSIANRIERVFLVGEIGLGDVLEDAGVQLVAAGEPCDAVIAGICRSFTYSWMNEALQSILAGGRFVATNRDATYPVEDGVTPGAGAVVASIATASGVEPTVIGKPNPYLVQLLLEQAGVAPAEALVVGDRYDTDILSGIAAGCDTHLVLTGVTQVAPGRQAFSSDLSAFLEPR